MHSREALHPFQRLNYVPKCEKALKPHLHPLSRHSEASVALPSDCRARLRWQQCRCAQKRPLLALTCGAIKESGPGIGSGNRQHVIRCGFCYDSKFESLTQLANHMVGKRHRDLFPHKDVVLACPYCGKQLSQGRLHDHIARQACPQAGFAQIPSSQVRKLRQKDLDHDPRFSPIIQEETKHGILKVRPIHQEHTFETALLCSEAFKYSAQPPRFDRMLSELRWHASQYVADPGPITKQAVDFQPCPEVNPPDVTDVMPEPEPVFGLTDLFKGPSIGDKREKERLQVAQTWGVWLWLVAELIPNDTSILPPGQDSIVIGATSLMLHDRLAALEKFIRLNLPLSSKDLNQNLFLSEETPPDLEYKSAAFIWWTSVDPRYRRQGIAGELLRACEAIGAAAGFWTFYIQADTRQHNHSGFLPFDSKCYNAAVNAYKKAGYQEYTPNTAWKPDAFWSQSAKLMYKTFRA